MAVTVADSAVSLPASGSQAGGSLSGTPSGTLDSTKLPYTMSYNPQQSKPDFTGSGTKLTGQPTSVTLTLNQDNSYTFTQAVRQVIIQNNSGNTIYRAYDAAATAGSLKIPNGGTVAHDVYCTVVHIYPLATTTAQGTSEGVVIEGYI